MIKHDWKKAEKNLYSPQSEPQLITIPAYRYLTIQGEGAPASPAFQKAVETLFSLSYGLKFAPRKGLIIDDYIDYAVYPLEGLWDLNDQAKTKSTWTKDDLIYTLMIRQPAFILESHVETIKTNLAKTKDLPLNKVKFEMIEEGSCLQILHSGPFDTEPVSFAIMTAYLNEHGYQRKTQAHKEIYLSDFNKTKPEHLKTILRLFITI